MPPFTERCKPFSGKGRSRFGAALAAPHSPLPLAFAAGGGLRPPLVVVGYGLLGDGIIKGPRYAQKETTKIGRLL